MFNFFKRLIIKYLDEDLSFVVGKDLKRVYPYINIKSIEEIDSLITTEKELNDLKKKLSENSYKSSPHTNGLEDKGKSKLFFLKIYKIHSKNNKAY